MAGPIEIGAYVIVALFALVFMVFRKPLRYRGRPLASLLLILVLTAALTAKLLCCPYLYRSLALYRFFPYLDQAIGFAVGPTFLLYVLMSACKKHRFYFLHYALSAAAFSFFILYAASTETVRDARILSIINRTDIPSRLFNYTLLLQFTAYFATALWMSRRPRWLAIAAAAGYVLFFPAGPAAAAFSADGSLKDEAEQRQKRGSRTMLMKKSPSSISATPAGSIQKPPFLLILKNTPV